MIEIQLDKTRPRKNQRTRQNLPRSSSNQKKSKRIDAATLASNLQLQEQRREFVYSIFALGMKFGLLSLGALSIFNLGFSSINRAGRHSEITSALASESQKLINLQRRFDSLFTIGGEERLMDEQDQWIAPNRVRIIWR